MENITYSSKQPSFDIEINGDTRSNNMSIRNKDIKKIILDSEIYLRSHPNEKYSPVNKISSSSYKI